MAEASPHHSSVDPHTVYSSETEDGSIWNTNKNDEVNEAIVKD